jgi:hypothetical protein
MVNGNRITAGASPVTDLARYCSLPLITFFFAVGALLYLPLATHAGYYDDDWFAMYAAKVAGPQIFREFYIMDSRPGRALVVIPLYLLFHGVPFYYALSAYIFRVLGALTFLWLLRVLWPAKKIETFLATLFFLIPAYTDRLSNASGRHLDGVPVSRLKHQIYRSC